VPEALWDVPVEVDAPLGLPFEGVVLPGVEDPSPVLLGPAVGDPTAGGVGEELTLPDSDAGGVVPEVGSWTAAAAWAAAWAAGLAVLAAPG
jgi:hypothetical protein